jgi:hypothetical protein
MRVLVPIKATGDSENGPPPTTGRTELLEARDKFRHELRKAGTLLAADGLTPSPQGKRITFDGPDRTVIDGPLAQNRTLVASRLYASWSPSNYIGPYPTKESRT